ncbi:SH3 domain-containing protein [Caviibacterium pharyngocola]|uniref:Uncharacterized protein n=1 Tax=Caviibacterium pharyngocola TaxID=28159 RepID=A0A2M8RTE1_9PAST|nr:SH3 domain-containing protein [Caviibacterium pharyngocola]PJG82139.1 hypothetical protein CVP04_10815 [Caviibacterium pharyngocola]
MNTLTGLNDFAIENALSTKIRKWTEFTKPVNLDTLNYSLKLAEINRSLGLGISNTNTINSLLQLEIDRKRYLDDLRKAIEIGHSINSFSKLGDIIDKSINIISQSELNKYKFFNKFQSSVNDLSLFNINKSILLGNITGKSLGSVLQAELNKHNELLNSLNEFITLKESVKIQDSLSIQIEDELDIQPGKEQQISIDILTGKETDNNLLDKQQYNLIEKIDTLLSIICNVLGIITFITGALNINIPEYILRNPITILDATEHLMQICSDLPDMQQHRAFSVRIVDTQELKLRKYDNKNAEILATLENGKIICVLKEPKDNARWLLVSAKLENGETVKGYVYRKYTKQISL